MRQVTIPEEQQEADPTTLSMEGMTEFERENHALNSNQRPYNFDYDKKEQKAGMHWNVSYKD